MTIDFSSKWMDEAAYSWVVFGRCGIGCCSVAVAQEMHVVPDLPNGCVILVSVQNTHGFYEGNVTAISMFESECVSSQRVSCAEKSQFKWEMEEALIVARQALIIFNKMLGGLK